MSALLLADGPLFGANERGIILFGFEIYYYALCIVTGIILATALSVLLMKRRNLSSDLVFVGFIFVIPVALICARLFYCITDGMNIKYWFAWSSIREGGLSIIGGLIGGVTTAFVVCRVKKVDFLRAADCVVPTILVAQALGRWGNFFNGEVYGGVVSSPSMEWFPFAVPIAGGSGIAGFSNPNATWHYAFFFYESMFNLIGFAILFTLSWKWNKKPNGLFLCGYLIWYGLVRTIMEPLRDPHYILSGGNVPWSLVMSILMLVGGVAGAVALLLLNYRKEDSLIGSKKGDPCGITDFQSPYKDEKPYYDKINMMGANYPERPPEEKRSLWGKLFRKKEEKEEDGEDDTPSAADGGTSPSKGRQGESEDGGTTSGGRQEEEEEQK